MPAKNGDLHGNAPDRADVALLLIDVINDLEFPEGDQPAVHRTRIRVPVCRGRLILLTWPYPRRGHFFLPFAFRQGEGWWTALRRRLAAVRSSRLFMFRYSCVKKPSL
jgi:hypothetical protein